jgi:hypothetical protein
MKSSNRKSGLILGLKLHWEEFVDRCSTHGIIGIYKNKAYFFKLMWLILFLGSSAFCFYLIVKSIDSYLKFEITTKIKITPQVPINFPIVKICDINRYSTEYAKKLFSGFFNSSGLTSPFNISFFYYWPF